MDLSTGKTYETKQDAIDAGVPESDLVEYAETEKGPVVRIITNGPFKGRTYLRNKLGQMVRLK